MLHYYWNEGKARYGLLEQVVSQKEEKQYPDMVGVSVKNLKYGTGIIREHQGRYLTVEFPIGMKKFAVSDVFAKRFQKIDNEDVVTLSKKLAELIAEEEKYAREIRGINTELSLMEVNIPAYFEPTVRN